MKKPLLSSPSMLCAVIRDSVLLTTPSGRTNVGVRALLKNSRDESISETIIKWCKLTTPRIIHEAICNVSQAEYDMTDTCAELFDEAYDTTIELICGRI